MKRRLALLALALLVSLPGGASAGERPKADAHPAALRMEDLEVRGLRERPDSLYAPAHKGVSRPAPVRYDLFLVDMNRAVSPSEIASGPSPAGDNIPTRSLP